MQTSTVHAMNQEHPSTVARMAAPFANLRGQALARFKQIARETSFPHGEQLFLEGEEPGHIFILTSGRVKLSVTSREGKMIILRIAGQDQCLGLAAALANTVHEISAEVLEPAKALVLRVSEFMAFLEQFPEAAMEATRSILSEYQATFTGMCRLALPATVAGRLANLLLEWRNSRIERGAEGRRLTVALTHGEIAEMTNTSRETVSRVFQQFQREKLIAVKGASVTVLQPQALEQLAW